MLTSGRDCSTRRCLLIVVVVVVALMGLAVNVQADLLRDIEGCSTYCGDPRSDELLCRRFSSAECWESAYNEAVKVADCWEVYSDCVSEAHKKACAAVRAAEDKRAFEACHGVWSCEYNVRQGQKARALPAGGNCADIP